MQEKQQALGELDGKVQRTLTKFYFFPESCLIYVVFFCVLANISSEQQQLYRSIFAIL